MAGNRRRHANTVQVGSLMKWIVIAVFLGVAGLSYVYLTNQMHKIGTDISKSESDLKRLKDLNEAAESRVALLSSHKELQRRLDEGFIKLEPITNDRIVRITVPWRAADEIRPVANRGMEK